MTEPARIYQQDIDRVVKSVGKSGIERARIVIDFANRRIEVIIGEAAVSADAADDDWTDED